MKREYNLDQFPYPFKDNMYRYSNNSVPLTEPVCIDITSSYKDEMALKRQLLKQYPERVYQSLPYSKTAQWEVLELIMDQLLTYYPTHFSLEKKDSLWTFTNHILDDVYTFEFGMETSLPFEPLHFIGSHVQEDLLVMGERDGDLYLDAGQLCFPANWSLAFDLGMSFKEIHSPIPGFKEEGLDERILSFLLKLEPGSPWGRKNWSLMAGDRLDTSLETFDQWGQGRKRVTKENAGEFVHLRVEVQNLFRLSRSNSILFTIHSHLLPLEKLAEKKEWLEQFYFILKELPPYIVDYKGISLFRDAVLDYLEIQLEGGGKNE
jgi:dimethylamine monooxygenase subunit A